MSDRIKIVMGGWSGSKRIISACSYLLDKYVPDEFDVVFTNFGDFDGKLYKGTYVDLGEDKGAEKWCQRMSEYLSTLDDEFVIVGVDDVFLSQPMNMEAYKACLSLMKKNEGIGCANLCPQLFHNPEDYEVLGDVFMLKTSAPWTNVVQMALWRRTDAVHFFGIAGSPWEFEQEGSKRFNESGKRAISTFQPVFIYPDATALSHHIHKNHVNVLGNKVEDVEELIKRGHLEREELRMGKFPESKFMYGDGSLDPFACLDGCSNREYVEKMLKLCLGEHK